MPKAVIIVLSDMNETHQDLGRVVTALQTAKEFNKSGDDVELIFEGAGVVSAVTIADPSHDLHSVYRQVEERISGICRYCSRAFEVYDKAKEFGLPFLVE